VEVFGLEKLSGRVTVEFDDLTVSQALKTVLANVNYIVLEPRDAATGRSRLVLRIHSMSGAAATDSTNQSFFQLPAFEQILEVETEIAAEEEEDLLDDPDLQEEQAAYRDEAELLQSHGAFGPKTATTALVEYAAHHNPDVRIHALKALAARPMAASIAPLLEALSDDELRVRLTAIEVLGSAKDITSLEQVGAVLQKGKEPLARQGALRVFALRADPRSIVYLQAAIKDDDSIVAEAALQMVAEFERRARQKKPNE
jgi:HEAT repeat protein